MYIAGSYFLSPLVKPLLNWEMGNLARNPDPEVFKTQFLKVMSTRPEKDRKCLEDDFVATGVIDSTREAFKQENDGVVWELKMYAQPWGFELEEVDFPGLVSRIPGQEGIFFLHFLASMAASVFDHVLNYIVVTDTMNIDAMARSLRHQYPGHHDAEG